MTDTGIPYRKRTCELSAHLLGHTLSRWARDGYGNFAAACQTCGCQAFVAISPASNQAPIFGAAILYHCHPKE